MIKAVTSVYYIADTEEEVLTITGNVPSGAVVRCFVNATGDTWKRIDGEWSGNSSGGVSLGETNSAAYRGDRGKAAFDHSQSSHANPNAIIESQARRVSALMTS